MQKIIKNTKSRIREDPGRLSKKHTPRGPGSLKIINHHAGDLVLSWFWSKYMVAAFGRSQKRAAAFGRRPLLGPYLLKIKSKLGLRHDFLIIFKLRGPPGYNFLIIFRDPPGFSILYFFLNNFGVSGRGPQNRSFLYIFDNFRDSRNYSLCRTRPV